MNAERKDRIYTLLKGIETGDEASVAVVSPDEYIQHNPQTHEGGAGLAALFKRLSKSSPRVNIARIFSDVNLYLPTRNTTLILRGLVSKFSASRASSP